MCVELLGLCCWSEYREYWEMVFWLAAVQQELVVKLSCLVTLILILHIDGEILPVGLHQVMPKGTDKWVFRLLTFCVVPAGLICNTIVGYKTFG